MGMSPPPTSVALGAQAHPADDASPRAAGFTHAFTKPVDVDGLGDVLSDAPY